LFGIVCKAPRYHGEMREPRQLACRAGGVGLAPRTPEEMGCRIHCRCPRAAEFSWHRPRGLILQQLCALSSRVWRVVLGEIPRIFRVVEVPGTLHRFLSLARAPSRGMLAWLPNRTGPWAAECCCGLAPPHGLTSWAALPPGRRILCRCPRAAESAGTAFAADSGSSFAHLKKSWETIFGATLHA
jgi:hypothetical protein